MSLQIIQIPTTLLTELKQYLKEQADRGDFEAQIILSKIEQQESYQNYGNAEAIAPPSDVKLGC